jgi:glucosyl-3-phosphoglycerate phosphatase
MIRKSVICIRHGESTFNAAWRATGADPLHFDAALTDTGHEQVRQARAAFDNVAVELVITSPLTRALQTASGLFSSHPHAPPIVVSALLRERMESSCDVGRSAAQLACEFPGLDLAHLGESWWHVDGVPDARGICLEPITGVEARVAQFRRILVARPERAIAVVGHGTFFFHLTGKALSNCETTELDLQLE